LNLRTEKGVAATITVVDAPLIPLASTDAHPSDSTVPKTSSSTKRERHTRRGGKREPRRERDKQRWSEINKDGGGSEINKDECGSETSKDGGGSEISKDGCGSETSKDGCGSEISKDGCGSETSKDGCGSKMGKCGNEARWVSSLVSMEWCWRW
jgi:hypothetical protein